MSAVRVQYTNRRTFINWNKVIWCEVSILCCVTVYDRRVNTTNKHWTAVQYSTYSYVAARLHTAQHNTAQYTAVATTQQLLKKRISSQMTCWNFVCWYVKIENSKIAGKTVERPIFIGCFFIWNCAHTHKKKQQNNQTSAILLFERRRKKHRKYYSENFVFVVVNIKRKQSRTEIDRQQTFKQHCEMTFKKQKVIHIVSKKRLN